MKTHKSLQVFLNDEKVGTLAVSRNREVAFAYAMTEEVTVKGKGKCKIYVYAQNGVYKTIIVTVK